MTTTILGLDGADWQIINPLLERDELPVIGSLIRNGCHGTLASTTPPNSPPAWASMITGVNSGKHNIFDFTYIDKSYRKVPIDAMSRIAALPLWQILNRFGRSTGVVNLPIHYPAEHVDGFVICGLVTPWSAEVFTYPPEISREMGSPAQNWLIGQTLVHGGSPEEFLNEIRHKTRTQADWILRLQKEYQPDFLMAVFDGTDKIQHFFWKYWDATHSRYDPMSSNLLKQAIPDYYRYVDACLGEIIQARSDSNIFIVSDHGFTGMEQDVFIENWLVQNGYLNLKTPPPSRVNVRYEKASRSVWNTLAGNQTLKAVLKGNKLSNWMIGKLKSQVQETNKNSELNQYVDWSSTRVFFAGVSSQSLQVNLKGREAFGIVEAEDYEALVHEVIAGLKTIRDPKNGKPVVKAAYEKEEIYHGDWAMNSPDLVVISEDGYSLQEGFPDHLVAMSHLYGMDRSGGHRPEGVYIASGPNIRRQERPLDAQITDIMPTVLYLNGIPCLRLCGWQGFV
jgi:predicted AlkP superfamily phosphohydrolase/phosphomutase